MNYISTSYLLFLFLTMQSVSAQNPASADSGTSGSSFACGTYMLAGSLSFNRSSYPADDVTMTTLTVAPSFLIFVTEQVAVGGQFSYTSAYTKSRSSENTVSRTAIGPLLRIYPFKSDPLLFLYAGVSLMGTYNRSGSFASITSSSRTAHAGFGFDFMNRSMLAIEPFIEYTWYDFGHSSDSNGLTFGVSFVSFHL